MGIKLGLDAKLYRNTSVYATPTWDEITNIRDLTLNLEAGEADVTTRGNNGWRATVATLKDGSIEFEMIWDSEDPDFTAIRDGFLNKTAIELAVMDGGILVTGSQGLRASFMVTSFSRNEPLEEAISVSVTMKPTYSANPPDWMASSMICTASTRRCANSWFARARIAATEFSAMAISSAAFSSAFTTPWYFDRAVLSCWSF